MARQRIEFQPAYVLHARPYRETSLLLEVFTAEYGRVGAVARGARRPASPLKGLLQPFNPLVLSWAATGELVTLTGADRGGDMASLSGESLLCGFYLNEILLRLVQRSDPHRGLFAAYAEALGGIADDARRSAALRLFEKRLLQELGYGLVLDRQSDGGAPVIADERYAYRLEHGPVPLALEPQASLVISGRTLLALQSEDLTTDAVVLREARILLRAALALYLGERPLHSRELLASLRRTS